MALRLGCSRRDITPPIGTRFVGHLSRDRPAESVLDPLFARVLSIACGSRRLLIVNLDLLELGPAESSRLEQAVREEPGAARAAVLQCATHTHTGPPTIALAGVPVDESYFSSLLKKVPAAAAEAMRGEEPAGLRAGTARIRVGVNRRLVAGGRVVMAPNPEGPVDDELSVVAFDGDDGAPRALLLGYAVHPTTLSVGLFRVSADYPGRVVRSLRERLGSGVECAFLQGACGDVKPAVFDAAGGFAEGTEEDIARIGRELADAALGALGSATAVPAARVEAAAESFTFVYDRLPTEAELDAAIARIPPPPGSGPPAHIDPVAEARFMAQWARSTRDRLRRGPLPAGVESRLLLACLGDAVAIAGVPGELFAETGLAIKRASPFPVTLVCGYAGGSVGYVPTAQALREGGYEASDAYKYYGHPAAFAPGTPDALAAACREGLRRLLDSARREALG